jgi:hypothetical protein
VIQVSHAVVVTAVAVQHTLQTLRHSVELLAGVGAHPVAIRTLGLGVGDQLLAEVGIESHARRHRCRDMANRLQGGDGQQEVGVRQGGGVCRRVKVDAPAGGVVRVEAEFVRGRVEKVLERDEALSVGALRQSQGVGAAERIEEDCILSHVVGEPTPGQLSRRDALDERVVQGGRGQRSVPVP